VINYTKRFIYDIILSIILSVVENGGKGNPKHNSASR